MNNPWVSVVIPTYNSEKFIQECVNSVLDQKYENFEIIIVNDGSTDRTEFILESFLDPRITIINQANLGLSAARNRGLALAKYKYVCFLDSDDTLHARKLLEQTSFMEKFNLVASGTQMNYIGESGKKFGVTGTQAQGKNSDIANCSYMPFPISSAMFLTLVAKKCGGFSTNLKQVEDLEFLSRVANFGEIRTLMLVLGCYRLHSKSMTATKFLEQKEIQKKLHLSHSKNVSFQNINWISSIQRIREVQNKRSAMYFRKGGVNLLNSEILTGISAFSLSLIHSPNYFFKRLIMRLKLVIKSKM